MKNISLTIALISLIVFAINCEDDSMGPDYSKITDIQYTEHVQKLFNDNCTRCHSGQDAGAGLKLDSWANLIKGSNHGEAIIPYDPANSLMIEMLTKLVDGPHPKEKNVSVLKSDAIDFLERWIDDGAQNDNGEIPHENSTNRLYVCNQAAATVSVIDTDAKVVIRNVHLEDLGYSADSKPHHIAIDPLSKFWYVSLIGDNKVVKFNENNEKVGEADVTIPALLAKHPTEDLLYVSRFMQGDDIPKSIVVVNTITMEIIDEILIPYDVPHAIAVSTGGSYVYTASLPASQLVLIRTSDNDVNFISLGQSKGPLQIAVSPDGSELYISAQLSNEMLVAEINTDTLTHIRTATLAGSIPVGSNPWHPVFSPDGSRVYVGNLASNFVNVIDTGARTTIGSPIHGNGLAQPHGIAISNDGLYVYVSNRNVSGAYLPRYDFGDNANVGTIAVINTATNQIQKVIEVEEFASGINIWDF